MAKKLNYIPWLIGGAAAWFLFRKPGTIQGIGTLSHDYLIAEKIDFLNDLEGFERFEVKYLENKKVQLFDKKDNLLKGIESPKERFTIYLSGLIDAWFIYKGKKDY